VFNYPSPPTFNILLISLYVLLFKAVLIFENGTNFNELNLVNKEDLEGHLIVSSQMFGRTESRETRHLVTDFAAIRRHRFIIFFQCSELTQIKLQKH
jgi:hypothetical protein